MQILSVHKSTKMSTGRPDQIGGGISGVPTAARANQSQGMRGEPRREDQEGGPKRDRRARREGDER
jgi:hypothetical protein